MVIKDLGGCNMNKKHKNEPTNFDEINVKRMNIVDEDGTIRMTLSNKERFPAPLTFEGKEAPREGDPKAGIVLYNDEGIECGGLLFSSKNTEEGIEQQVLLAMDGYAQNDVVDLGMYEKNGERGYALVFSDRPKKFLTDFAKEHEEMLFAEDSPERREYIQNLYETGEIGFERMKIEKSMSGEVSVNLSDSKGRQRIRLAIDETDVPKLEFLDEEGEVAYTFPPEK